MERKCFVGVSYRPEERCQITGFSLPFHLQLITIMTIAESINYLFRLQAEGRISREEMSQRRRSLLADYAQLRGNEQRGSDELHVPISRYGIDWQRNEEALKTSPGPVMMEMNQSRGSSNGSLGPNSETSSATNSQGTFTHSPYSWANSEPLQYLEYPAVRGVPCLQSS